MVSKPESLSERSVLRFTIVGSVDDGKSTLIGRLLHDSDNVLQDQLEAIQGTGDSPEGADLSLLTDGLEAERSQGITIDVAYRYFATERRNFIVADTPGHVQYTRNMATGASTASLAIILVDAQAGVITQTRRHAFIASLLGIPRLLIAVNKMDRANWSEERFEAVRAEFVEFATRLGVVDLDFIPVSALLGDNVVKPSERMGWYPGPTVLEHLERVYVGSDRNLVDFRFPVQTVIRPSDEFRGYAGQVTSGRIRPGEKIVVLPSGRTSQVTRLLLGDRELPEAAAGQSIVLCLEDEIDITRGDLIARPQNIPTEARELEAMLVWMDEKPLDPDRTYRVLHTSNETKGQIRKLRYRVNVNELHREPADTLALNEIGRVSIRCHRPLFVDAYDRNRGTGSFILIDPDTNATVGAGMVVVRGSVPETDESSADAERNIHPSAGKVSPAEHEARLGQRGTVLWLTGLSGSGKSTLGVALERTLFDSGSHVARLDGDNLRGGLNKDLGFSRHDRRENIRRTAEVCRLLAEQGQIVIASLISPYREERELARTIIGDDRFREIHVHAPLEVCEGRDPKGLYQKARKGEIANFTGIDDAYEEPESPDLRLDTSSMSPEECLERLLSLLSR